jgi:hypothetical protein
MVDYVYLNPIKFLKSLTIYTDIYLRSRLTQIHHKNRTSVVN